MVSSNRRRRVPLALLIALSPAALAAQALQSVGHTDLGGAGLNGDVSVLGTTAFVGAGMMPAAGVHAHLYNPYPCPAVTVKVVDLAKPEAPKVVATIPVPAGVTAHGVSSARVRTPSFTGDLLAVALATCGSGGGSVERGVAYYDVTRPSRPVLLGRYQADADIVRDDSIPACGAPPARSGQRCASSQHSVSLIQRADGRVLSLSVEPGASASKFPSGDFRVVDVTDPRKPVQVGAFPPSGAPIFSTNGCRPFSAGHGAGFSRGGTRALGAFYDGGVFVVDLDEAGRPTQRGTFTYPTTRSFEGSAAYVAAATVDGRDLALISEADFIPTATTLQVDGPSQLAGSIFACEAIFTLYDPQGVAPIYRQPNSTVRGALAYVGVGCAVSLDPDMHAMDGMDHGADSVVAARNTLADAYLTDPAGRIALIDRGRHAMQPGTPGGSGCSIGDRVRLAQAAGARAAIILQTSKTAPEAFSPDGAPAGITIPVAMIDRGDSDRLRSALCPRVENGLCAGGEQITAALRGAPGEWGALRVIDVTDPDAPVETGVFRSPRSSQFPPPELAVFSPQRAMVRGSVAVVPWNSDGARVIDLSGGVPRETGWFVPPDVADPTGVLPAKAYVMSIGMVSVPRRGTGTTDYVVVSDLNSGLYVVAAPWTLPTDARARAGN
ncbi:MAG: hypothetical protein H0W15_05025 [Gemmatimonadales bacterium]|nr:hypothetical protein [Gemmatimonadales bacterium]